MNPILRGLLRQGIKINSLHTNNTSALSVSVADAISRGFSTENKYDHNGIEKLVKNNKVVVFMKGNPEAPRCGFSNAVVQIMRMHGVDYDSHDVLQSEELRQGIKDFTNWPTIPQVFINGEFIGGCDIVLQMHQSGDLIEELKKCGVKSDLLESTKQADSTNKDKDKK